jgi:hypothetical protein
LELERGQLKGQQQLVEQEALSEMLTMGTKAEKSLQSTQASDNSFAMYKVAKCYGTI